MSINKLPTIKSYWDCGKSIGNEGIRNVVARSRFEDVLRNLHFLDNAKDDKVRYLINHFNQSFSNSVSNDESQSIVKHMVTFKGRSCMKQYVKSKPIKGGFKFWCHCASETGYLFYLTCTWVKKKARRRKSGIRCCFENDWITSK